jgi:hypothetical protein
MAIYNEPRFLFSQLRGEIHQISERVAVVWQVRKLTIEGIGIPQPKPWFERLQPPMIAFIAAEKQTVDGLPLPADADPATPFRWCIVDEFDEFDGMNIERAEELAAEIKAAIAYAKANGA